MNTMRRVVKGFLFGAVMPVFLAACGGGGGSDGGSGGGGAVTYVVTPSAGSNGSISPASAQTVVQGATASFTITADSGYSIAAVTGCGGTLSGSTYATGAITTDCTVTASFALNSPDPPAAASLTLTPTAIKTFSFTWDDVSGETEYRLLENPDGSSGFTQVASIAADATTHELEVFLPGRINASYILQACNSGGCSDSAAVFVSGSLAEAVGYIKASNSGQFDSFGFSIALAGDGSTLAVGAWQEDSNANGIGGDQSNDDAPDSGAVYVFYRNGLTWSQQAYLKGAIAETGDRFGWSVGLSDDGNTLAVGAMAEDSAATGVGGDENNNDAFSSGAVYLFTRTGTAWSQEAYLKASNTGDFDQFGSALALAGDGNTLAVSAGSEASNATGIGGDQNNDDAPLSGAVYVFVRSDLAWSQQAYIKASNSEQGDRFGFSVAMSGDGDTLAVGARGEASNAFGINGEQNNNDASGSGAVYVFTRSATSWSQQAYVKASNPDENDQFGWSIALSGDGDTLATGTPVEFSNARGIDGDQSNNDAPSSGAVYVFFRSGGIWSQQAYVKTSNSDPGDQFGWGVALSGNGNRLAVAAHVEDSSATGIDGDGSSNAANNSGAVYVFTRSQMVWSQQAYIKATNTELQDQFGWSLALSADGSTLAVGGTAEDSSATGIGGDQENNDTFSSGAVYLY